MRYIFDANNESKKQLSNKKLMIVGAGLCQVPIIQLAAEIGFKTIVVSIGGDYPGLKLADKAYEIDVRDKESILEVARQEKICGILTDQTDIPVTTVAYVAEQLNLPGIGYECALRFTDKYRMRRYAEKLCVPVPPFSQASTIEDASLQISRIGLPVIIKPVDNQGSRGVAPIHNTQELYTKFNEAISHSACRQVIIEKCISGTEVVVQGFVTDYKYNNLVIGDRRYFDIPDLYIPSQTLFPSELDAELRKKILAVNDRLISGFRPRFGITHSEYLVDEHTGDIRLVEAAIRGGGVFISSDLVPLACGIDVNRLLITAASDNDYYLDTSRRIDRASAYVCFYLPEGTISRIEGMQRVSSMPGVHRCVFQDINIGNQVFGMTDKTMRLGPIIVKAKNRQCLEETIDRIKNTLFIEVDTNDGPRGIIW